MLLFIMALGQGLFLDFWFRFHIFGGTPSKFCSWRNISLSEKDKFSQIVTDFGPEESSDCAGECLWTLEKERLNINILKPELINLLLFESSG
ncbi:hypothetical protein AVEN_163467-1 [Araneus ventricosus]|uniref:Uncharacterized protein n=1 Tax=Araneus ventricosus TaxID=182803 RepID=A0A4Y2JTK3_ARAVE|nr:hypothetical protein AVEN_163467-1 [Araneus ventricosus]